MPPAPDVQGLARDFADRVSKLLNGTVAHGVRLSAVLDSAQRIVIVGRNVTRTNFTPQPVPLTITAAAAPAWLLVAYVLDLDPERDHLAVVKSQCSVYLDEGLTEPVVRYEYDRAPPHDYPAAHVQVHGTSEAMARLCERAGIRRDLHRFHLPVGGRRYRPSVEDVIEFLVVEGLVDAHTGWKDEVAARRREWFSVQLMAAVRRDPDTAAGQLRKMGYRVTQPPQSTGRGR